MAQTLLSPTSTALYSPYVTSGAEALRALAQGQVRRVSDDTPVPPDTLLKTMYEVVVKYFSHGEAKAANPYGMGELARPYVEAIGVDVTDKESNRLAQAAAEDTANVVGGREQFGSRGMARRRHASRHAGGHAELGQLTSLFDEELPDLLAASCLSRRTIDNVRHGTHEPAAETWSALEVAMELLDPSQEENIAGWRDLVTADELARSARVHTKRRDEAIPGPPDVEHVRAQRTPAVSGGAASTRRAGASIGVVMRCLT